MRPREGFFLLGVVSLLLFSHPAQAGWLDSLKESLRSFNRTTSFQLFNSNQCTAPGEDAPQNLINQFCDRVVSCVSGQDPDSVRRSCVLRMTSEDGKALWGALSTNLQDSAPTALVLSRWIQQDSASVDTKNYCACSSGMPSLSCEAIQARFNINDFTWADDVVTTNSGCKNIFTGPLSADGNRRTGNIHVFARGLNEQNEGVVFHWEGPPGGTLWGRNYWFHPLRMRADHPVSVDYHKPSKQLVMAAYVKDGGDLGGAGSVHAMHCKVDGFTHGSSNCGADNRYYADKVHYNPTIIADPAAYPELPDKVRSSIYFNAGNNPMMPAHTRLRGLFGFEWLANNGGDEMLEGRDRAEGCFEGEIEMSPTTLVSPGPAGSTLSKIHFFGVIPGDQIYKILYGQGLSTVDTTDSDGCAGYPVGEGISPMKSSPKAMFGPSLEPELYALGTENRPFHWVIDGNNIHSERIVDIQANMSVDDVLGVVRVPSDQSTHVFFRQSGPGTVVHSWKSNAPASSWATRAGITSTAVLDSPSAVTDPQGNIHLFAGEWGGPNYEKAGQNRAYLHHFVKAAGSNAWQEETLFLGNVQHTDQGASAATSIFIGPDGQTTEANRTTVSQGINPSTGTITDYSDLGAPDLSRCAEGFMYQEPAKCEELVGRSVPSGSVVSEAYACNWKLQYTQQTARAAGLCPSTMWYVEYNANNYACEATTNEPFTCPTGFNTQTEDVSGAATLIMHYCTRENTPATYPCANSPLGWQSRQFLPPNSTTAFAFRYCCVR